MRANIVNITNITLPSTTQAKADQCLDLARFLKPKTKSCISIVINHSQLEFDLTTFTINANTFEI